MCWVDYHSITSLVINDEVGIVIPSSSPFATFSLWSAQGRGQGTKLTHGNALNMHLAGVQLGPINEISPT